MRGKEFHEASLHYSVIHPVPLSVRLRSMARGGGEAKNHGPNHLRLPILLYQLKKTYAHSPEVMKELQNSTNLLFAGKRDAAQGILEKLASRTIERVKP